MPNDDKSLPKLKLDPVRKLKLDTVPFMDTLRPEKPTGDFKGGLVEPKGRQVKVAAPGPAEEPTKSFGINKKDMSPVGPSIHDKSE